MSNPDIWGPPLWRLLHAFAEKLGRQTNVILISDEQRAWINFLKSVEIIIPCKKCKNHYILWRTKNRPENFASYPNYSLQARAREWVWGLHTEINQERKVENVPLADVQAMYQDRTSDDVQREYEYLLRLLQAYHISPDALRIFKFATSRLKTMLY
jgi:Erv1 / Alr family